MNHKVGAQGLIVPFGYVTVKDHDRVYQQGQAIPPGEIIVDIKGDSENDPARNTETLMRLCGIREVTAKETAKETPAPTPRTPRE